MVGLADLIPILFEYVISPRGVSIKGWCLTDNEISEGYKAVNVHRIGYGDNFQSPIVWGGKVVHFLEVLPRVV